ncbi:MAG: S8 family serine peptidase [Bacteriovoracaceae bacterium]
MSVLKTILVTSVLLAGTSIQAQEYVPGEVIIKYRNSFNKNNVANKLSTLGAESVRAVNVSFGNFYVAKFDTKSSIKGIIQGLESDPDIEYSEPNYIYKAIGKRENVLYSPNDPQFSKLWGLNNTGSNDPNTRSGVAGADIKALKAWEIERGDRGVKIAVIDTGIDYNHKDLRDQMWVNEAELNGEEGVDDDGNGYVDDIHGYDFANNDGDPIDGHGHGTHCAGTIGASHNDVGVAGVMENVTFIALKFLTDQGSGSTEGAIKSIDYATKMGVDIMSNSWGGGAYSEALKEAIERAAEQGIIFTAAAGNSGTNNDASPHYPSNYDVINVISVAASDSSDKLASFSCYGSKTVHIAAPGKNILSTVKNNGYAVYSGTSMATPHVSGALGLLISKEGRLPLDEVRDRVMATSDVVKQLRGKVISGSGRLNTYNLLTDTRPERTDPKESDWVDVSIERWETAHPYQNNADETRTYNVEGAKFLRVVIKKYELENKYDTLSLAGNDREESVSITGSGENFATNYISGNKLKLTFKSDRSITKWGFVIEKIQAVY